MMFVKICFIGLLINVWHCQGYDPLTNDGVLNPHLSLVFKTRPTAQTKFSLINGLIFTHIPRNNQYTNHHVAFGVRPLENNGGHFQLNYFTPNEQLPSRNHGPVSPSTLIENDQTFQWKPLSNGHPINPIPYFFLPPKLNYGPPFLPQPKYSRSYLASYPRPSLRSVFEYMILKASPRINVKSYFNNVNSQRDGSNQALRDEYLYRPSIPNNLIHQKQDATNSDQALRNNLIELHNQASSRRQNSIYSQSINPFLMKLIQSNDRNNRAKKHINFYQNPQLVFNNKSSIENCPDCRSSIFVHSTPKSETVYSLTSHLKQGTAMVSNITLKDILFPKNSFTSDKWRNINSTNEIVASTEKVISTGSDLNYGQKIHVIDIPKIDNEKYETQSSTEIIIVFKKNNSTSD